MRDPKEMEQLHQLLSQSDVIVENFRPGTMKKMGLGWESLHQRHPHLISAHVSGFGQTGGPGGNKPAMDVIIQAMSGIMEVTGFDDKPPSGAGTIIEDVTSGLFGAIGVVRIDCKIYSLIRILILILIL